MSSQNNQTCPACGGPIGWLDKYQRYQCYVCDFVPKFSAEMEHLPAYNTFADADDFLEDDYDEYDDEYEDVIDFDIDVIPDEDIECLPLPVYQERESAPKESNMRVKKKGALRCAQCGNTATVRGNKLKRLYGPNKDICLTCHYANKSGKTSTNNRRRTETSSPAPIQQRNSETKEWVIFGNNNEFIGKYNSKQAMIAAIRPGCSVYRLEPIPITVTVQIGNWTSEIS